MGGRPKAHGDLRLWRLENNPWHLFLAMVICRRSPPARSRVRTGSCRRRGGGPAAGARWRPTRAAAATAGSFRRPLKKRQREGPKTSAPRPLRAGRAQRALRHPEGHPARDDPAEGPEERWSRRLEASRPMRPGRENRGDATGRPTLKIHFRRPLLAFFKAGVRLGARARGGFRAPDFRGGLRSGKVMSKRLQKIVGAGDVGLAGRVLDVERAHDAVLDHHRIALRARAEAEARAVHGEAEGLREIAVAVGDQLDL